MPLVIELLIIIALFTICAEGLYGLIAILLKKQTNLARKIFRYFCIFILFVLAFGYFALPSIAYNQLGGKEILAKLSPKWLPSDQPDIVRLEKKEKNILFAMQSDLFIKMVFVNAFNFPKLAISYFDNSKQVDINRSFFGISIDPNKTEPKLLFSKLKELGAKSVLMRINYQKDIFDSTEYKTILETAKNLKEKKYDVLIVIAQNRDIFTNEESLDKYFEKIFTDFAPYANEYQIGATINRPKWGVIRLGDYENFFNAAKKARDKISPNAKLLAPSVIDFEWLYAVYYANAIDDYDILNSLLYVDRVGFPENTQMGADTIDKIKLMSAVDLNKPFYITEFNWPLAGTGDYKPTSDEEAVDEFLHAAYNTRYALLALGSNRVNKLYYWQLFANGYGLIDHLNQKEKPSFRAYKALIAVFGSSKEFKLSKINEKCYSLKDSNKSEAFWCTVNTGQKLQEQNGTKYYDMFGASIINPTIGIAPIYAIK